MALAPLLLLQLPAAAAQEVEASVDRAEVARGETLIYTIRVHEQRQGMQLDLTPLTRDFDVLGTRTSSQIRSINGAVESWTDYIITLFPLSEGDLEIPPIDVGGAATEPVRVRVVNRGPRSNQSGEELFLELEINKDSVYVQEQLLFTVRLFYTINGIRNPQFTEPEMPDTVIQLIGSPNQYERLIDETRYGVYEKRYVIFPQRSGPLEIPDILFRGEVTDGSSNFVFRNLNTRRVTAFTDGITIEVKERPESARGDEVWLPVTDLAVEQSWSADPAVGLRVGDSVVRTVTATAKGVDGAVLPPLGDPEAEGLNIYPEPSAIDRAFENGAIIGTRTETVTLVPTEAGMIEIPGISIPWWNVDTDRPEVAVVPAVRIAVAAVAGELPSEQAVASTVDIEELLDAAPVVDQEMIDAQARADLIEVDASWARPAAALALLLAAAGAYRLAVFPRRREIGRLAAAGRRRLAGRWHPANNERVALLRLRLACRSGEPAAVRRALVQWCGHFAAPERVRDMEDVLRHRAAAAIHPHAAALQSALYGAEGDGGDPPFRPAELLRTVMALRRDRMRRLRRHRREMRHALPPLYRV